MNPFQENILAIKKVLLTFNKPVRSQRQGAISTTWQQDQNLHATIKEYLKKDTDPQRKEAIERFFSLRLYHLYSCWFDWALSQEQPGQPDPDLIEVLLQLRRYLPVHIRRRLQRQLDSAHHLYGYAVDNGKITYLRTM